MKLDEYLAISLMLFVFIGVIIAAVYMSLLASFFKELRKQEIDIWEKIGSPTLFNMLLMPFVNFRKFYAFLPELKIRRTYSKYQYANKAYFMFQFGLIYCCLLIANIIALAFFL